MSVDELGRERQAVERMFPGGGEMGARMRAVDWSTTSLGPVSTWPRELRTFVGMVLANHFPMNLLWGPELVQFYNDAYIPLMGDKHPAHLGRRCRDTWAEIWPQVGPRFQQVLDSGISATHQQQLLFLHRYGFFEESYFTDSYAPLWGAGDRVEGVLVTVVENTEVILAERRLRALKELATRATAMSTRKDVLSGTEDVLRQNASDVPFALLYLHEGGAPGMRLVLAVGLEPGGEASPVELALDATLPWPLAATRSKAPSRVDTRRLSHVLPGGPWPEPSREALVFPLYLDAPDMPAGFLVLGASPRLRLDEPYHDFLRMLAAQVSTTLVTVHTRQRSEQEQHDAHERVTGILETLGDVFLALDGQWHITRVNSKLERLSGLRREEMVGRSLWEVWPYLRRGDRRYEVEYRRCMEERVPVHLLDHVPSRGLWLETRAHPTPDGGIAILVRDVGEQKRAEAELDRFFALSPDMLCVADFEGHLKRFNPAWERTLGWSEAELASTSVTQFVHPDEQRFHLEGMEHLFQGRSLANMELRMRHRDGSYRWLSWSVTSDTHQRLLFAVARDVTDARHQADEAKGRADFEQQLIGIVSHDLRTPLSTIILGAQSLLRREVLDTNATRLAVRIHSAAERGTRMVRDLLDFTQARLGGGLPIQPAPVDLHLLVRQVLDEVQMSYPEREFQMLQQGDARGEWDGDRMVQLLTNLVTNAAKYSPAGSIITVLTSGKAEGVELEVHNTGNPILPEVLSRLFQPMQRGRNQAATSARSVGLGLYIVKHIVDVHGGDIEVSSTDSEGTTFRVRLPREVPDNTVRTEKRG
ncbi:MAG: PAS domain S-box protein [Cystobacter sp.]